MLNEGGTVKTVGEAVVFDKCDSLTILLAADTNYINEREKEWRGEHPHKRITAQLAAAEKREFSSSLRVIRGFSPKKIFNSICMVDNSAGFDRHE